MRPQRTTPNVVCAQCGKAFHVNPFRLATARFCGKTCYGMSLAVKPDAPGRFRRGGAPWNKGAKGLHLSPSTEFRPGHRVNERYTVGDVIRRCSGQHERNYVKTLNGWVFYAVWLWEQAYGPVIKSDVVHHLNGDRFDDRLENLIALPRKDHPIYHGRWGCKPVPPDALERYRARYDGART